MRTEYNMKIFFNKATNSHKSSEWDVNNNNNAIVNRWLHEVNQTSWVLTAACYTYGLSGWRYRLHVVRILTVHNTLPTRPLMLSTRSQPLAKKSSSERMLYSDIVIRNSFEIYSYRCKRNMFCYPTLLK